LRSDLSFISENLAIYQGLDVTERDVKYVLSILQSFDPAGIGASSLQECLLLQIARREDSRLTRRMRKVIRDYFDDFTKKHWEKIRQHLKTSEYEAEEVIKELRKLNPRPGASLGETMGRSIQQVTPDFIIDTDENGQVTMTLNNGELPQLFISRDFEQQMLGYQNNSKSLNRMEKEALLYTKEKVERARGYIDAIERRRKTLTLTMQAIIKMQHKYFLDGDEADLVPMTMTDIAEQIGMDVSTVSRVCNAKYAETPWGIFKLRHFFSSSFSKEGDEEMSNRKVKIALADIIKAEDKKHPLSDDAISKELKKQGFPVARRTVAKYREALGIPVARLRR
jgi:RNA polymerase sigma-54 factor